MKCVKAAVCASAYFGWPAYFPLEQWMACVLSLSLMMVSMRARTAEGQKATLSHTRRKPTGLVRGKSIAVRRFRLERVFFLHEKVLENMQRSGLSRALNILVQGYMGGKKRHRCPRWQKEAGTNCRFGYDDPILRWPLGFCASPRSFFFPPSAYSAMLFTQVPLSTGCSEVADLFVLTNCLEPDSEGKK